MVHVACFGKQTVHVAGFGKRTSKTVIRQICLKCLIKICDFSKAAIKEEIYILVTWDKIDEHTFADGSHMGLRNFSKIINDR